MAAAALSVLSTGVNAKIYPDQIVRGHLGDDVCRSGYRPLDRFEAEEHKTHLYYRAWALGILLALKTTGYYGAGLLRANQTRYAKR
ncbi:hypothetical protein OK016_00640 [Vibrio chagasii]|nr:hypothetical protein [Vibrio chagasii]